MSLFYLDVFKRLSGGKEWCNRYVVDATDLIGAVSIGKDISNAEKFLHSTLVNFTRVRASTVTKGDKQFLSGETGYTGEVIASKALKPEIVARVVFPVPGTYPNYKDYRPCLGNGALDGFEWNASFLTVDWADYQLAMSPLISGAVLKTPTGVVLQSPYIQNEYEFRSMDKAWYNRASATP